MRDRNQLLRVEFRRKRAPTALLWRQVLKVVFCRMPLKEMDRQQSLSNPSMAVRFGYVANMQAGAYVGFLDVWCGHSGMTLFFPELKTIHDAKHRKREAVKIQCDDTYKFHQTSMNTNTYTHTD